MIIVLLINIVIIMFLLYLCMSYLFFFFKPKTAYEMRISDWSSDVCPSDLEQQAIAHGLAAGQGELHRPDMAAECQQRSHHVARLHLPVGTLDQLARDQRCLAAVAALYQRAQVGGESDPALTVAFELADLGSMQRRCAGPGIDLRAQAHHAEIRQGDPFTPTDHGMGEIGRAACRARVGQYV